ncbi:hypothetical protein, variant [Phytophthora nicotianae INRA-310]|uniref:Uncharacterized protein n=1 Tax=Phytophthora nicotianae (strain INRA-310) TaxID=761204 RepID=W2R262_PHYN3|nr:hypothetical protein PPTG_21596 [Phytophthora nicotianae INRA-310]XP_008896658.1 hypothetical protein, variant [Phytophthora nicotianae INRA-310]ETN18784.1 hypothetical protein PPTG_21596 [Phytophthora nicotianae INRA-310]ETN18785.1 hypothetical protein, variant [Phytophthora nicotianae INRA-310]
MTGASVRSAGVGSGVVCSVASVDLELWPLSVSHSTTTTAAMTTTAPVMPTMRLRFWASEAYCSPRKGVLSVGILSGWILLSKTQIRNALCGDNREMSFWNQPLEKLPWQRGGCVHEGESKPLTGRRKRNHTNIEACGWPCCLVCCVGPSFDCQRKICIAG